MRCSHYRTVVDQPKLGIRQLSSLHELGAQLVYLTEKTKKTTPKEKAMCLSPCLVMCQCLKLEHRWKKGSLAAVSVEMQSGKKEGAQYRGQLFNTSIDVVRPEKRLVVSLYVNEFLD